MKKLTGIVWKVLVNGKDAQDEYDQMDPIGVGNHEFKVYFQPPNGYSCKTSLLAMELENRILKKQSLRLGLGHQMVKSIPLLMILILVLRMESIELECLELVIWTCLKFQLKLLVLI